MDTLCVQNVGIGDIRRNGRKLRKNHHVAGIAESIRQNGWFAPIVIDEHFRILIGTGRFEAAKLLGMVQVPVVVKTGLTEDQKTAMTIIDNKLTEQTEWDQEALNEVLADIDFDFGAFNMDPNEWKTRSQREEYDDAQPSLRDRFIVPPFSVLDARSGPWQERKKKWQPILCSGCGRDDDMLGIGLKALAEKSGATTLTGTSIFDPVLCEILIQWFCPPNGRILDPFAGGSVRGMISALLGRAYTGYDLSARQCEENVRTRDQFIGATDLFGNHVTMPEWIHADSRTIPRSGEPFDMILSCPPYAFLERYSDDPTDLSTMDYDTFRDAYFEIISRATARLREDSFAVFVVGEIRDRKGHYCNFVSDTIRAFIDAGMTYYNEAILVTSVATLAMRVGKPFTTSRKLGKTHQNVLCFRKNGNNIGGNGEYEPDLKLEPGHRNVIVGVKGDERRAVEKLCRFDDPLTVAETDI